MQIPHAKTDWRRKMNVVCTCNKRRCWEKYKEIHEAIGEQK